MSTTRLTFLYPHLFRTLRHAEGPAVAARQCVPVRQRRAAFAATAGVGERFAPRRGKGVEPIVEGEREENKDQDKDWKEVVELETLKEGGVSDGGLVGGKGQGDVGAAAAEGEVLATVGALGDTSAARSSPAQGEEKAETDISPATMQQ